jgi:hypothetical protein
MVDPMIDIDRRFGPCTGRVWGLVANLIGNVIAMYGLAGYVREGSGIPWLASGIALTISCIFLLSRPQPGSDPGKDNRINRISN